MLLFASGFDDEEMGAYYLQPVGERGSIAHKSGRDGGYSIGDGYGYGSRFYLDISPSVSVTVGGALHTDGEVSSSYFTTGEAVLYNGSDVLCGVKKINNGGGVEHQAIICYDKNGDIFVSGDIYPNTWVYIELQVCFSTGLVTVRADNRVIYSEQRTWPVALGCDKLKLGLPRSGNGWDDLYVLDGSGSKNTDFLGDVKILPQRVTGQGQHSSFTPIGAPTNWEAVVSTDNANVYNEADLDGMADTYEMTPDEPIPSDREILGVSTYATIKKITSGTRYARLLSRKPTGGDVLIGNEFSVGESDTVLSETVDADPATGLAWDKASVDATEFGLKITE